MTNEKLIRRYYDGDEQALELLYEQNCRFIISIAEASAKDFNCLQWSGDPKEKYSSYTQPIMDDLCAEGAAEFISRIQLREYDETRGKLTTYLYPHLKGVMWRWLEQNLGNIALSKDEMAEVRQVQRLHYDLEQTEEEIAAALGIPLSDVADAINYSTHFFSVHDLTPNTDEDADGDDLYSRPLFIDRRSATDGLVYLKICLELLWELFDELSEKDRTILGHSLGVFCHEKWSLEKLAMEEIMTVDGIMKAKAAALQHLKNKYPGSKLDLWRKVYWLVKNTH